MNKECEIVQDLLPLYVDGICSESSRQMIDHHLSSCAVCSGLLKELNNNEIEEKLKTEKTSVLKKQASRFKRRSALVGAVIACVLMVPVLICLIVNLAQGTGMTWFFVVLASLLLAASLIITPLMMPQDKCLWTLGLSTAALMVLLGVCCIYTGGDWFLVSATSILFGLSVIFLPFVLNNRHIRDRVNGYKGLICMGADTLLYLLMMVCIGFYVKDADYPQLAVKISLWLVIPVWILFAVLRYLPFRKSIRAGICCIVFGFAGFAAEAIAGTAAWPKLHLFTWSYMTLEDNVKWLFLLACLFAGILLIIIGLVKGKKK